LDVSAYAGMTNIIYFLHYYQDGVSSDEALAGLTGTTAPNQGGGPGCSGFTCAQLIHSADGIVPVIFNEWGPASDQNPNDTAGQPLATAMTTIEASGIGSAGFLFWDPNGSDVFNQVNNGGTKNSTYSLTTWGFIVDGVIESNPFPGGQ
jgi:hypothetical protein